MSDLLRQALTDLLSWADAYDDHMLPQHEAVIERRAKAGAWERVES